MIDPSKIMVISGSEKFLIIRETILSTVTLKIISFPVIIADTLHVFVFLGILYNKKTHP